MNRVLSRFGAIAVGFSMALAVSSGELCAQDAAPERISNTVVTFDSNAVPLLPLPLVYSEDGYLYSIRFCEPGAPLIKRGQYSWRKTGAASGVLTESFGGQSFETIISSISFSAASGRVGNFRNGNITGSVRLVPFSLESKAPLRNSSVRVELGRDGTATLGFVAAGATSRRVIVRAVGPGLAQFGVSNAAPDPVLVVFNGANEIAANRGWAGAVEVSGAAAQVGAFGLAAGSRD
jgi:hypothetical protein